MDREKEELTRVIVIETKSSTNKIHNVIRGETRGGRNGGGSGDFNQNPEEVPCLPIKSNNIINDHFNILDDFIRFDVSRSGAFCCSDYSVSIQYEDDFLIGTSSSVLCCPVSLFRSEKSIKMQSKGEDGLKKVLFRMKFTTYSNCFFRPKRRSFEIEIPDGHVQIGSVDINSHEKTTRIHNYSEKCIFRKGKISENQFLINDEAGGKVGTIEISRGLRGGISSYGLSILDDSVSSTTKALMISTCLAMDIEDRESEAKCSLLWAPLIASIVIILFTLVPWWYSQHRHYSS